MTRRDHGVLIENINSEPYGTSAITPEIERSTRNGKGAGDSQFAMVYRMAYDTIDTDTVRT